MRRETLDDKDTLIMLTLEEGPMGPGPLSKVTGISYWTLLQRLEKLIHYGYLPEPKHGKYSLGDRGRNFLDGLSALVKPTLKDPSLQKLFNLIPTQLYRAFLRLQISAIIGKRLLFNNYKKGYPNFIMMGDTGGGKSTLEEVICRLFSFKKSTHVIRVPAISPGELLGRRVPVPGGGHKLIESRYSQERWICFNEYDDARSEDIRRGIQSFLDDEREFMVEGQLIQNHAVIMVALNPDPKKEGLEKFGISTKYMRRSVAIDTNSVKDELVNFDLAARKIDALKDFPKLRLEEFTLTQKEFKDKEYMLLRKLLLENTKKEFIWLVDALPFLILSLGCSVLLDGDVGEAIYQTVWDGLICLESLGGTVSGWRKTVRNEWVKYKGEEHPELKEQIREAADKRKRQQEQTKAAKRQAKQESREQEEANQDFQYEKGKLIKEIKAPIPKLQHKHSEDTNILKSLWRDVKEKAKTPEDLEYYRGRFGKFIAEKVDPILEQEAREAQVKKEKADADKKMMKEFFADMTTEDKKKMMMEMMPQMMMGMMNRSEGEGGMMGRMGKGKDKGGMMEMMPQMMHEMMGDMNSEDMMKTMHEMMPRMMGNCLNLMSKEQRRDMFAFCRKMLGEMEEQFLPSTKKEKTDS